jgi:hypothetical protein
VPNPRFDDSTGLADFTSKSSLFAVSVLILATLLFSSQLALAQFTQQRPKLVRTGVVGRADHGYSVALSADGNTAIVGGLQEDAGIGTGASGPSRAAIGWHRRAGKQRRARLLRCAVR